MSRIPRIGLLPGPSMDPFWVQVLEATFRKAEELGLDLISIDADLPLLPFHFGYKSRLVTTQNVAKVAGQKLIAMANLSTLLTGSTASSNRNAWRV